MKTSDILFAFDLDGTLLPKNKEIPYFTKRYLKRIIKRGYKIVLCSGRPARNIEKFQSDLGLTSPIIALNGLHIHYPNNEKKDHRIYFPPDTIKNIVKLVNAKFKIKNIICETDKEIYITNKDAYLQPEFWLTNMKVVYGTLEENLKHPVMTFLMELEDRDFDQAKLKQLFDRTGCDVRCWVDDYQGFIEIFNIYSNKAAAIIRLAKELKVDIDNVFAFGDDLNDIEMLRELPNSYVMKNAKPDIKKFAKHETRHDNEHEGVKKEVKAIIKKLK
ncbi:MAG: HAD family hydrolase [Bacilli bacterium]|nr:HAD family hydrolase [Bacilli bacterium]